MRHGELRRAIDALPSADPLSDTSLNNAIDDLSHEGYVIQMGEEPRITYKANLREKTGKVVQMGVWHLDHRLSGQEGT